VFDNCNLGCIVCSNAASWDHTVTGAGLMVATCGMEVCKERVREAMQVMVNEPQTVDDAIESIGQIPDNTRHLKEFVLGVVIRSLEHA